MLFSEYFNDKLQEEDKLGQDIDNKIIDISADNSLLSESDSEDEVNSDNSDFAGNFTDDRNNIDGINENKNNLLKNNSENNDLYYNVQQLLLNMKLDLD